MRLFLVFLITPFLLIAERVDPRVDFDISFNPGVNILDRICFTLKAQKSFEIESDDSPTHALLIDPQIAFYLDGSVAASLSLGHRYDSELGVIGHHIFFDKTSFTSIVLNQVGTGFDILGDTFEFSANYYHPLIQGSSTISPTLSRVKPHKWVESEFRWKTPYAVLSAGPTYNFFSNQVGAHGKVSIPFSYFDLGVGGSLESGQDKCLFFTVSFRLYRNKGDSLLSVPAGHTRKVKHSVFPPLEAERVQKQVDSQTPSKEIPAVEDKKDAGVLFTQLHVPDNVPTVDCTPLKDPCPEPEPKDPGSFLDWLWSKDK